MSAVTVILAFEKLEPELDAVPLGTHAQVEVWDARGIKQYPFKKMDYADSVQILFDPEQIRAFYGFYISRFYFRVVSDREALLRNTDEEMGAFDYSFVQALDNTPDEFVWMNSRNDHGSWFSDSPSDELSRGVIDIDQLEQGGEYQMPITGRYVLLFDDQQMEGYPPAPEHDILPASTLSVEAKGDSTLENEGEPIAIKLESRRERLDTTGAALVRIHSLTSPDVQIYEKPVDSQRWFESEFGQKHEWDVAPKIFRQGVAFARKIDEEPDTYQATFEVVDSSGNALEGVAVELRDDEDMGKGPFRSLVTDENGEAQVEFTHEDLLDFYGRKVERFYFQVVDKKRGLVPDRILFNTKKDDVEPSDPPEGFEEGIWRLFKEDDFTSSPLELRCAPHFLKVKVLTAETRAPVEPGWLQLYRQDGSPDPVNPEEDSLIEVSRLDQQGNAKFRIFESDEEADNFYYLRLLTEDRKPVVLLPFDAPEKPATEEHEAYWTFDFPAPSQPVDVEERTYMVESDAKITISGRLVAEDSEDGLADVQVEIFGNESDENPAKVVWTDRSGSFHAEIEEPVWMVDDDDDRADGKLVFAKNGGEDTISVREQGDTPYNDFLKLDWEGYENDEYDVIVETDAEAFGELREVAPETLCG